jgi:AraC family transcriptional regulator
LVAVTEEILRLLATVNGRGRADVSLAALAALAFRSPFHLHRRFRAVVGETPKGYTTRVRLARAAAELLAAGRISAIAERCGFASHEVFTRAFTRTFGLSPRAYRARGLLADDDRALRVHAAVVRSAAPCVGLYHLPMTRTQMTHTERSGPVPVDIVVKDLPVVYALIMRRTIGRDEIAAALSEILPAVFGYAQRHGLALTGPPFTRYPQVGMGSIVIEGGVPVAALPAGEPGDGIETLTIPAGPAAVTVHYGPYDRLPDTYGAVDAWIREQGHAVAGPPWETYLTDPGERPDPETWETEIVQPIA